jgi:hypothetical protein
MTTHQSNGRTFASRASRPSSRATRQETNGGINAKARYERYVALARESVRTGDAVETENYYQHAEHYYRVMNEEKEQRRPRGERSSAMGSNHQPE